MGIHSRVSLAQSKEKIRNRKQNIWNTLIACEQFFSIPDGSLFATNTLQAYDAYFSFVLKTP